MENLIRKCKCKNGGVAFDSGEVFEDGKTYVCEILQGEYNEWVKVFDNVGKSAMLQIDGTFKQVFNFLRY